MPCPEEKRLEMNGDEKPRSRRRQGRMGRIARRLVGVLWPSQRQIITREGFIYFWVAVALLAAGLLHQVNLILLVFTLSAGPFGASIFGGRAMLHRLSVRRRLPTYVFSGERLIVDYTVENGRRWFASLAVFLEDSLVPVDSSLPGAISLTPSVFFARIAGRDRLHLRWQTRSPYRGKYQLRDLDLGTRAPFGLVEHRVTIGIPDQMIVYPRIGHLTRRWYQIQRPATENRQGQRHDRSAQQVEYHGLRNYRAGDSPRWIHWRTSARRGELMVKEFEHQNEQDLAILIDPWLPRARASDEQRETVEQAISFAATLCIETARHHGRRITLGWTGAPPGVRQGPASVKLLHELLEQLAVMMPVTEGGLAALFDIMPPAALREALLVIVSTRPINLIEEAERSSRFSNTSARGLLGRVMMLNATQGDLSSLFQFDDETARDLLQQRQSSAIKDRRSSQAERRRGLSGALDSAETAQSTFDEGDNQP
jgi:uncharacterized protein (DUF58 family)